MSSAPAIELAPGIFRIPTAPFDLVNSYALVDEDGSVTLVDCGLRWTTSRILRGLDWMGKHPGDVQRVLMTHAHSDHAGGLQNIATATGGAVIAHEDDAPYLRTGRVPRPEKLIGRIFANMPGVKFGATPVSQTVADREVLDVAGGVRVIHTPGHTPGHISLLHESTGTLITGDSIFNVAGLRYSPQSFCTNSKLSRQTAETLGDLEYEIVAFTHGAEIRNNARDTIRGFLHRMAAA